MQGLRVLTRSGAAPTAEEVASAHIVANTHKEMKFGTILATEQANGVEVEYHAHKNMAFVSGGLPYYVSPTLRTPYDIDSMRVGVDTDVITNMTWSTTGSSTPGGGSCPFGSTTSSYAWVIWDSDTGGALQSGSGEMHRCFVSCGGGGCSFTGYATNVPDYYAGGTLITATSSVGSTSGCTGGTCFNSNAYDFRGASISFNSGYSRVRTTLGGVIYEVPRSTIALDSSWDGTSVLPGQLQTLNSTTGVIEVVGTSSVVFDVPPRVAYSAVPLSGLYSAARAGLMQRRRNIAAADWAALKAALAAGTPPAKFMQAIAPGVVSTKAVRANSISVSLVDVTAVAGPDQTLSRDVSYEYAVADGVVTGVHSGARITRTEYATKRNTIPRVLFGNFLDETRLYDGEYLSLPPGSDVTVLANTNIPAWSRPAFLLDYWRSNKLVPLPGGIAAPTNYDATQNTPGVVVDVMLFSAVFDGAPIGPIAVLDFPSGDTSLGAVAQIAVHGIIHAKYSVERGEFEFVRWQDLNDFVVDVPAGITVPVTLTALAKYAGYGWEDLATAAAAQDVAPEDADSSAAAVLYRRRDFIKAAVTAARQA